MMREIEQPLADDSIDLAKSLDDQGKVSYEEGDYNNAVTIYRKALEMRQRLFPGDHQDVAQSYHNLGLAYYGMKDYERAI